VARGCFSLALSGAEAGTPLSAVHRSISGFTLAKEARALERVLTSPSIGVRETCCGPDTDAFTKGGNDLNLLVAGDDISVGTYFVPLAIGSAVFVQNGLPREKLEIGVTVSRAYWGLLATLLTVGILTWTCATYVKKAKTALAAILVPPNRGRAMTGYQSGRIASARTPNFQISGCRFQQRRKRSKTAAPVRLNPNGQWCLCV
jgi:hypothetical protein